MIVLHLEVIHGVIKQQSSLGAQNRKTRPGEFSARQGQTAVDDSKRIGENLDMKPELNAIIEEAPACADRRS
jgi:hypothetical protein